MVLDPRKPKLALNQVDQFFLSGSYGLFLTYGPVLFLGRAKRNSLILCEEFSFSDGLLTT